MAVSWDTGNRIDSRLAREHTIALPIELTSEQNKELVEDFIKSSLVARGMVADYNITLIILIILMSIL